jgi:predicted nucleotidyltransferase component of viral defense system
MFQLIKDIFSSSIWRYLAFKWWTACYFLYGLDRFSTDLDFDLLDDIHIDDDLMMILKKYGTIKRWSKIILSYGEHDINIKIDINRKIRHHNTYEFVDFYGTMIQVQDKSTIFANKLVALTQRSTNRDIYDVYFFFQKLFDINIDLVSERTWSDLKSLYHQIIDKLHRLPTNYKILDGLWELLDARQKHRTKTHLVSSLLSLLHMKIKFDSWHVW